MEGRRMIHSFLINFIYMVLQNERERERRFVGDLLMLFTQSFYYNKFYKQWIKIAMNRRQLNYFSLTSVEEKWGKCYAKKSDLYCANILPKTKKTITSTTAENNSNQTFSIWYETKKEPDYSNYMMCINDKIKENGIWCIYKLKSALFEGSKYNLSRIMIRVADWCSGHHTYRIILQFYDK